MKVFTPLLITANILSLAPFTKSLEYGPAKASDHGKLGGVASEKTECSTIGTSMLREGGTAADAMVATVFCVGVLGMYHSGVGGGGFMLVRGSNGSYEFIDFRETAPAAAFQDMYNNDTDLSEFGGLASGVPGELRGLERLHQNYGCLSWATVMKPAIDLARYGYRVDEDLVHQMQEATEGEKNFLVEDPTWAIDFAPNGTLVKLNDIMYRKRYADTLEIISMYGANVFYHGAIAETTIAALKAKGGTMTTADLSNYTIAIRKPAQIAYRDYKVTSSSAPSSGVVALSTLKIVEGYPDFGQPSAINESTYRLNEAMRWAYAERANLGDPSFTHNLQAYEDSMLSPATAAEIRPEITPDTHNNISYYDVAGLESLATPGTSQISVADASGMAISLTTTVNLLFGSQLMVPETGVIMNNEMNDFSIPNSNNAFGYRPSPANFIRPGKRPLSSISTTIVEKLHESDMSKALFFVIGAGGGSRITTATIQNLWHVLDQGMSATDAIAQPRLHDQLSPNTASFEYLYDNSTVEFLRERSVNVSYVAAGESAVQGVKAVDGVFEAAGEPRQVNSGGQVA